MELKVILLTPYGCRQLVIFAVGEKKDFENLPLLRKLQISP